MKTILINLYEFDELSDEAKQKAISELLDINTSFDWWEDIYEDASNVRLEIKSFDLDRSSNITGDFTSYAEDCANSILENHGENCETHNIAKQFIADHTALVEKHSDGIRKDIVSEGNESEFDQECDELESEFKKSILNEFLNILQRDCDYRTSEETIIETIQSNEYDFTELGKLY